MNHMKTIHWERMEDSEEHVEEEKIWKEKEKQQEEEQEHEEEGEAIK